MILHVSSRSAHLSASKTTSLHFAIVLHVQAWSAIKLIQIKVRFSTRKSDFVLNRGDPALVASGVIRDGVGPPASPAISAMPPKAEVNSEH